MDIYKTGNKSGSFYMQYDVSFKDEDKKLQIIKYKGIVSMDFIVENLQDDKNDLLSFCELQYKTMTEFILSNSLDFRDRIQFDGYSPCIDDDFLKNQGFYD